MQNGLVDGWLAVAIGFGVVKVLVTSLRVSRRWYGIAEALRSRRRDGA